MPRAKRKLMTKPLDSEEPATETRVSVKRPPPVNVTVEHGKGIVALTMSSGREVYPVAGGSFEIGPVSVSFSVEQGEDVSEVFGRMRLVTETLMQAEYDLKRFTYQERLGELKK